MLSVCLDFAPGETCNQNINLMYSHAGCAVPAGVQPGANTACVESELESFWIVPLSSESEKVT